MKSNFKRLQFDPFSCWLLALIILVGGCSSTAIKSQRLAPEAEPGNEFGIIYQMIKPQFTISTIEATDTTTPPKYTLNVEFVPDANRRFAVSSHPGTFSDSDLTVNLNSNGAMTGLTHTSREQITPTIKAVGDFAASIIGAAATYAGVRFLGGESERQVAEQMRNELEGRLVCYKNKKVDQLEITPDLYALPESWSKLPEERKKTLLINDADDIINSLKPASSTKDIAHLAKTLKPKPGTAQVNILKALAKPHMRKELKCEEEKPSGTQGPPSWDEKCKTMPLKEKFDCQIDAFRNVKVLDDPAIKNDSELAKNLAKELAETPDLEKVLERERKLVVGEVEFAKKNEDLQTLLDYSLRVRAGPWEKSKAANILMLQAGELSTSARKVMLHETTFPNLLGPLIKDKTPAQQIYEVVKNKQEEIVKNKALLVTDPANRKDYQQKLDKLTSEFHEIIGAADEYYEIIKLQGKIKTGPPNSADVGHSSPFQEYAAARAQLSAVNENVTLKLGKVAADAADPPPAKKAEWTPAPVEKAFCWNYSREKMELKTDPPPRILVPESSKNGPGPAERVATRVASEYGADINSWPKYVVVIGAIKEEEVKP